jgi:hypothetical protein
LIQDILQADSIIALSQSSKEFYNAIEGKADLARTGASVPRKPDQYAKRKPRLTWEEGAAASNLRVGNKEDWWLF